MENLTMTYYLNVKEFAETLVDIPANAININRKSTYLAGIANLYNPEDPEAKSVGRCSASFLCLSDTEIGNIYTDIGNYLSLKNGLIVSWFTPSTLANLELDTIINGMVTECIVLASTKIGKNPFYGDNFNLKVYPKTSQSEGPQVWFTFTRI